MREPSLESIDDYNTFSVEKKKVVFAIVISSLIMGGIYTLATSFDTQEEVISIDKTYKKVPMR